MKTRRAFPPCRSPPSALGCLLVPLFCPGSRLVPCGRVGPVARTSHHRKQSSRTRFFVIAEE